MLALPTDTFQHLTGWWTSAWVRESTTLHPMPPPSPTPTRLGYLGLSAIYLWYFYFFPSISLAATTDTQAACTPLWLAATFFSLDGDAKAQINMAFRATKKKKNTKHRKILEYISCVCERTPACNSGGIQQVV